MPQSKKTASKSSSKAGVDSQFITVVLAAGKGTRMKSRQPKVLHYLAGKPMLTHVVDAVRAAGSLATIVVLNSDTEPFEAFVAANDDIGFAIQENQQGTADAVAAAACLIEGAKLPSYCKAKRHAGRPVPEPMASHILVCAGDVPCISSTTLVEFFKGFLASKASIGVLGIEVPDPKGYGRMVLDKSGRLRKIVEDKDASAAERQITFINTGVIIGEKKALFHLLGRVKANNSQNEFYLTSVVDVANGEKKSVYAHKAMIWQEFAGVNDRSQLGDAEAYLVGRKIRQLQASGVTVRRPHTVYVEDSVVVGEDSLIEPGASLKGATVVGARCVVGQGVVLDGAAIGNDVILGPYSILAKCNIRSGEVVKPLTVQGT